MNQIRLAPMCGVTDHIFRTICDEMGCDLAYTEMISAMGYLCAPEQRATRELMVRGGGEKKLILQLFGRDPDTVAEAAKRINALHIFEGFDINMGCPAKKIAPSGEGSGLMRTPVTAAEMMKKTVQAVDVPVSVKMRLGYDGEHINATDIARMAEDAGISEITVHGRTREDQYSGQANWDAIAEVKEAVSCPVIGNGDIFTAEEALFRLKEYTPAGIMIGRGAMGNPWIFRDIKARLEGRDCHSPSPVERYEMIMRHYRDMLMEKPERIAVREMRKHIGWYIHGLRGAGKIRVQINQSVKPDDVFGILKNYFENLENIQEENPVSG